MQFTQTFNKSYYMLVNCNSCQKKFTVPNSAITNAGRLLQCGSCGNKWMQYPIKEELKKEISEIALVKTKNSKKVNKSKILDETKKRKINLYSEEYLKKKHGLVIKDSLDSNQIKSRKKITSDSNFFNYLVITTITVISLLGILNLLKELIIMSYPLTETYINTLYDVLGILGLTISNLIN